MRAPCLRVRSGARCGRGERTARRKAKVEEHQLSAGRQEAHIVRLQVAVQHLVTLDGLVVMKVLECVRELEGARDGTANGPPGLCQPPLAPTHLVVKVWRLGEQSWGGTWQDIMQRGLKELKDNEGPCICSHTLSQETDDVAMGRGRPSSSTFASNRRSLTDAASSPAFNGGASHSKLRHAGHTIRPLRIRV